jgi:hypothetical protein
MKKTLVKFFMYVGLIMLILIAVVAVIRIVDRIETLWMVH